MVLNGILQGVEAGKSVCFTIEEAFVHDIKLTTIFVIPTSMLKIQRNNLDQSWTVLFCDYCIIPPGFLLPLIISPLPISHLFYKFGSFLVKYSFLPLHFPGHGETLIYDIVKNEWSVAIASPPSSITANKVCPSFMYCHLIASFGATCVFCFYLINNYR